MFEHFGINPPRGIVLFGAPGTGKTLIAKAIAHEAKANFISIKGPEMVSRPPEALKSTQWCPLENKNLPIASKVLTVLSERNTRVTRARYTKRTGTHSPRAMTKD